MCWFTITFVNKDGLRITVQAHNANWFGIEEAGRKVLDSQKEHEKYGPWTYQSATRIG